MNEEEKCEQKLLDKAYSQISLAWFFCIVQNLYVWWIC